MSFCDLLEFSFIRIYKFASLQHFIAEALIEKIFICILTFSTFIPRYVTYRESDLVFFSDVLTPVLGKNSYKSIQLSLLN